MKIRVFWGVVPCSLGVDRRFRGAYCLHHQGESNLNIKINFKERVWGDPLAALVNTVINPRFSLQVEHLRNFFIEGHLPSERLPHFEGQDLIVVITFQSTWQACVKQLHFH
jgi:hypothetical protein